MLISNCCSVPAGEYEDIGICPKCKEHCEFIEEEEKSMKTQNTVKHCLKKHDQITTELDELSQVIANLNGLLEKIGGALPTTKKEGLITEGRTLVEVLDSTPIRLKRFRQKALDLIGTIEATLFMVNKK